MQHHRGEFLAFRLLPDYLPLDRLTNRFLIDSLKVLGELLVIDPAAPRAR
jgi:hypothetical protein